MNGILYLHSHNRVSRSVPSNVRKKIGGCIRSHWPEREEDLAECIMWTALYLYSTNSQSILIVICVPANESRKTDDKPPVKICSLPAYGYGSAFLAMSSTEGQSKIAYERLSASLCDVTARNGFIYLDNNESRDAARKAVQTPVRILLGRTGRKQ